MTGLKSGLYLTKHLKLPGPGSAPAAPPQPRCALAAGGSSAGATVRSEPPAPGLCHADRRRQKTEGLKGMIGRGHEWKKPKRRRAARYQPQPEGE